jgi:hypothetical protein
VANLNASRAGDHRFERDEQEGSSNANKGHLARHGIRLYQRERVTKYFHSGISTVDDGRASRATKCETSGP